LYRWTLPRPRSATLCPYTTLFRSEGAEEVQGTGMAGLRLEDALAGSGAFRDPAGAGQFFRLGEGSIQLQLPQHLWPGGLGHGGRSEEHTSELQSREKLVCRLLLAK